MRSNWLPLFCNCAAACSTFESPIALTTEFGMGAACAAGTRVEPATGAAVFSKALAQAARPRVRARSIDKWKNDRMQYILSYQ
jgi:hypothetical protein